MRVQMENSSCLFWPWRPSDGRVFVAPFAFDCETTRLDEERPWLTPAYVLGAACDGRQGVFVQRNHVAAFFAAHAEPTLIFHHAPFDLAVLHQLAPQADLYRCVEANAVWDTQLLHRLLALATAGHTASGPGESTLEHCLENYLGVPLPKDLRDADDDLVRLSYGKWLHCPPHTIPTIYLEYLAQDALGTFLLYSELRTRLDRVLRAGGDAWGFVSDAWLDEQIRRWGPQTHHLQLRAAIVLRAVQANGLHLDRDRQKGLTHTLEQNLLRQREALRAHGFLPDGPGSANALQAILQRQAAASPAVEFPRTPSGQFATAADVLQDLAADVPFIAELLAFRETQKLLTSFVAKMGHGVLHPSFNVLARTGRTTSFGEINAQNLPADDQVRSCFVPSPGHVFLDADYQTIELVTLAQACQGQFGLSSAMAAAINAGKDLHRLVAARVTGKPEAAVTKTERSRAKPINFGKPGGMGAATLRQYAKAGYGLDLSVEEVQRLTDAWLELFPEMKDFLGDSHHDTAGAVALLLGLTPADHGAQTDDVRFLVHPENEGREQMPHPILGAMFLKAMREPAPSTGRGQPYSPADLEYFWAKAEASLARLPAAVGQAVRTRTPSPALSRAFRNLGGLAGVFTLTGRLRAAAGYCARHNTVFQGLAADGAKLSLWKLWRAGYRIVNFVHDQMLLEVPVGADLTAHAQAVRDLMIQGMQEVVPDVQVQVSVAAASRWYKGAEACYSPEGALLLWEPPPQHQAA